MALNIERIFLQIELILIIAFLVLSFIELIFCFSLFNSLSANDKSYYYNLIAIRLIPSKYASNINISSFPQSLNLLYPNERSIGFCQGNYSMMQSFFEFDTIINANILDTTNTTERYSKGFDGQIQNNIISNNQYFKYDLQQPGNSTISFKTSYEFISWKGYGICVEEIYITDPKAFAFIPKTEKCDINLNNKNIADCGIFFDSYRFCLQLNLLKDNNQATLSSLSNNDPTKYCPYNYLSINFTFNNVTNNYDQTNQILRKISDQSDLTNSFLFVDLDIINLGNYQKIQSPNETLFFSNNAIGQINVNNSYGFSDEFTNVLDEWNFMDFYNDTYYTGPIIDNKNNLTFYEPEYFESMNSGLFYLPTDSNINKIKVSLPFFGYSLFSKNCFENVVLKNNPFFFYTPCKHIFGIII